MTNAASVLEAARAKRAEIREKTTFDLDVPNTDIIGKFRALSFKEVRTLARKNEVPPSKATDYDLVTSKELDTFKDTLILALIEFGYDNDNDEFVPLDDNSSVRWSELAAMLNIDLSQSSTGRYIVSQLFGDDFAVFNAFQEYSTWMDTDQAEVEKELFTQSESGPKSS